MPERSGIALVFSRPDGSYGSHPVTADSLLNVLARLIEVAPKDCTWTVEETG